MNSELLDKPELRVQINGEVREITDELKLSELVNELSLAPERVAIELNQKVVRRTQWPATMLAEGDRIEIVHFVGGGEVSRQKAGGIRQQIGAVLTLIGLVR